MGIDAALLEARAQGRGVTPSGYAAHVLRAHLRTDPPMPYREFEGLKRVVNELAGVRGAPQQVPSVARTQYSRSRALSSTQPLLRRQCEVCGKRAPSGL